MVRLPALWYAAAVVVKLVDLIAGMLASQELRERDRMAAEAGLSPEEAAALAEELGIELPDATPHEERHR